MNRQIVLIGMLGILLSTAAACDTGRASAASSAGVGTAKATTTAQPVQTAQRKVARIVFLEQKECCDCTRKRIDGTWAALQAAFGGTPAIPIERIAADVEAEKAKPYQAKRPLMVMPGVYFLDEHGEVVGMLQGELTAEQIQAVLQGGPAQP